jgi:hypothetical protein
MLPNAAETVYNKYVCLILNVYRIKVCSFTATGQVYQSCFAHVMKYVVNFSGIIKTLGKGGGILKICF